MSTSVGTNSARASSSPSLLLQVVDTIRRSVYQVLVSTQEVGETRDRCEDASAQSEEPCSRKAHAELAVGLALVDRLMR